MSSSVWLRAALVGALCVVLGGSQCDTGKDDGGSAPRRDAGDLGVTGGSCVTPCNTEADCCSGDLCNDTLFNFACNAGRCEQLGCLDDNDCRALPRGRCGRLGSFGACSLSCAVAEDCCPPLPPGVTIPDGQDSVTVAAEGGGQATFYRCGVYPQKFACTGLNVTPDDAGTIGICLRICTEDNDCPGVLLPVLPDGGLASVRVDAGFVGAPLGDGGFKRYYQQKCVNQFGGIGSCTPQCETNADCCADPTGVSCSAPGARKVCSAGVCVSDGCRGDEECTGGAQCLPRTTP
jgi:hypothetical protein